MFNCMKYRLFNIILVWLLGMAAICSCSVMDMENIEEGTVVISGCISEAGGRKVLEGVKVHFSAYTAESESGIPVEEQSVYTDGKGVYTIIASGFTSTATCTITAEADGYKGETKEVLVNWEGSSFDARTNTFYVNDCDFHLTPSIALGSIPQS